MAVTIKTNGYQWLDKTRCISFLSWHYLFRLNWQIYHQITSVSCRLCADPSRCNSTYGQNPLIQQKCSNFWTNGAMVAKVCWLLWEVCNFVCNVFGLYVTLHCIEMKSFWLKRKKEREEKGNLYKTKYWNSFITLCSLWTIYNSPRRYESATDFTRWLVWFLGSKSCF